MLFSFKAKSFMAVVALALFAPFFANVLPATPVHAVAGINEELNYQARLLTNTGAVVPDGTYNMEFKIYQDGDGDLGGGDETLKWTETRTGADKVTVTNGYFAVQLGSVTAFVSSVDWNQSVLWLSINIGGTGSPSWDGEMDPFRRLSAAPYALNSKQLGGLDWSKFVQVAPSAVQTDSSNLTSLFINKTGASGNILELQNAGNGVFTIGNAGGVTIARNDSLDELEIGDNVFTLNDGASRINLANTANDSYIRMGEATLSFGFIGWQNSTNALRVGTFSTDAVQLETNSAVRLTVGSSGGITVAAGNALTVTSALTSLTGATSGDALNVSNSSSSGNIALFKDNTTTVLTLADGGAASFQNSADSTAALRVLSSGAVPHFVIDTTNSRVYIGDPTADATGALLVLDTKNTSGDPTGVNGGSYYNSDMNLMRCYENSVWKNCVNTGPTVVTFTASGTFSKATYPWASRIKVMAQAGGGGGGGSITGAGGTGSMGSGGGGGGYAETWILVSSLGTNETVTVGAAGAGVSAAHGTAGGDSSFGTFVVATGGDRGFIRGNSSVPFGEDGGAGGCGTAGTVFCGSAGSTSWGDGQLGISGAGGSSHLGGGGIGRRTSSGGQAIAGGTGKNYGGGGGGSITSSTGSSMAGGNGAPGIVIVEVY